MSNDEMKLAIRLHTLESKVRSIESGLTVLVISLLVVIFALAFLK